MNVQKKASRDQLKMISFEDNIEKDSMVRDIDSFVDASDLKELGFIDNNNHKGRPSYPIDVMIMEVFVPDTSRYT